jgi:hypothetical protein
MRDVCSPIRDGKLVRCKRTREIAMRELRRIVLVTACSSALLGVTTPAYASDASLIQAYNRYAPRFQKQDQTLSPAIRDFRRSRRPARLLNIISRLRITVGLGIGATKRETPSTTNGARAKALMLAALGDLGNALVAFKQEVLAAARGHNAASRRQFRRKRRLLLRGADRERQAFALLNSASSSPPPSSSNPPPSQSPPPQSSPPPSQPSPTPLIPGFPIPLPF